MNQHRPSFTRAAALSLAAAALPFTAATAQEAQPTEAPAAETTAQPPAAETSIPPAPEPTATAAEVDETSPAAAAEAEGTAPVRTTTTRRATTRTTAQVPAAVITPVPVTVAPIPVDTLPTEAIPLPPPVAQTPPPEILPETSTVPLETAEQSEGSILPWLLAGLLLVGALAFFALRGRRRTQVYESAPTATPAVAATPVVAPVAAATPVAAESPAGRPELDLEMHPVRAGVSGQDARVEFQLTVGNRGTVAAEDVRISTWMLASSATDSERALIEPGHHADTPPVTIAAGEARTVEASVALPTSEVGADAVLPVVVADARYRLPDGSEGRTSASFAVGVPDGEELAHFGIENPSGLHEGVVARPLGEVERV